LTIAYEEALKQGEIANIANRFVGFFAGAFTGMQRE